MIELDVLYEKYYMSKTHRIQMFGEILDTIKDELSKRDLSDIPTEKLFDLLMKYDTVLQKEKVDITFKQVEMVKALEFEDMFTDSEQVVSHKPE